MGTLGSLSKSTTSTALDGSEIALLVFGLLLVVGAVGESAKSDNWKSWHGFFELLVIMAVAGELIADGGIFVFSKHLQTISDSEIAILNVQAAKFSKDAAEARRDAAEANHETGSTPLA
jgi:hypothetical protein